MIKCGGPDSNRRTPTGMDPKSIAFNLARQPPQLLPVFTNGILKVFNQKDKMKILMNIGPCLLEIHFSDCDDLGIFLIEHYILTEL